VTVAFTYHMEHCDICGAVAEVYWHSGQYRLRCADPRCALPIAVRTTGEDYNRAPRVMQDSVRCHAYHERRRLGYTHWSQVGEWGPWLGPKRYKPSGRRSARPKPVAVPVLLELDA